jgi:hypothetical protein
VPRLYAWGSVKLQAAQLAVECAQSLHVEVRRRGHRRAETGRRPVPRAGAAVSRNSPRIDMGKEGLRRGRLATWETITGIQVPALTAALDGPDG